MIILAWSIIGLTILRTAIALFNLFTRNELSYITCADPPKVSVLIPARNEEATLPLLLRDLENLKNPPFEIWVCDDHSTDGTANILQQFSGTSSRISYFSGKELPAGWLGKNFACHQLATKAKGDLLLFLDADVRVSGDALFKAACQMQQNNYALLSIFPTQTMKHIGEYLSVPIMNSILLNLLPLPLVRWLSFHSLSAANGQFMLFDAANYHQNGWHSQVRNHSTEDIAIARLVKKSGGQMATLLGGKEVFCRMYQRYDEALMGFSRNVHHYFGGSRLVMWGYWLAQLLGGLAFTLLWGLAGLLIWLGLVIINRMAVTLASRQPMKVIGLTPLHWITLFLLAFKNSLQGIKKESVWKGRKISV